MNTKSAKYIRYRHTPGVNVVVTPETKFKALYDEYAGSAYTSVKEIKIVSLCHVKFMLTIQLGFVSCYKIEIEEVNGK